MDNIPPMMVPKLIEAFDTTHTRYQTVTIAVDVRSGEFFDAAAVARMIRELVRVGHPIETVFMEASDETILNRFRDAERMDVIRIMKLAGGYIQELYRRGSPSRPWQTKTRSGAAAQKM